MSEAVWLKVSVWFPPSKVPVKSWLLLPAMRLTSMSLASTTVLPVK